MPVWGPVLRSGSRPWNSSCSRAGRNSLRRAPVHRHSTPARWNAERQRCFRCEAFAWVRLCFRDQTEESRMSTVDGQGAPVGSPSSDPTDLKLEAIVVPMADADRSKAFYARLGWRLDADFSFDNGFRIVQFTAPGSPCSEQFGTHITGAPPGSAHGLYLIVSDIEAGR